MKISKLKKYSEHQKKVVPEPQKLLSSGIACAEKRCSGEMMVLQPEIKHPGLKGLRRAVCSKCGWRGWV